METTAVQEGSAAVAASQPKGFSELDGADFFKVLIAQLVNQDPLEPTSNQELLQQMSSIREIELNANLTQSLQSLSEQQQLGSASSLIGRFVTGQPGPDGQVISGKVLAIRFATDGQILLQLDSGVELEMSKLDTVTSIEQAAGELVGKLVRGVDTRDPGDPTPKEGVVTAIRTDGNETLLELDSGEQLRFLDVLEVGSTNDAGDLEASTE
ncbi:MAG: hypothetical protein JSV19_01780 [Phycisphaerales bacterium]|nr:MAG: hypothetical protein JSV19_01780 [Phycisphaerales bacterium]